MAQEVHTVRYLQDGESHIAKVWCEDNRSYLAQLTASIVNQTVKSVNICAHNEVYTLHFNKIDIMQMKMGVPLLNVFFSHCKNLTSFNVKKCVLLERACTHISGKKYRILFQ